MTNPAFTQLTFRGRNDDGNETAATWKATAGTDWTQDTDTNFRVRFRIDETASRAWTSKTWNLYYSYDGGAYTAVASGQPVKYALSSNFAQGNDCTEQLTGGTGTFVSDNNGMCESAGATNSGSAGYLFEVEYCLQIDRAYAENGKAINLRVYDGTTAIAAYTDTPIITVNKPLVIADTSMLHSADAPSLTQHNVLTVADASMLHNADNLTVTYHDPTTLLVIADVAHSHNVDSLSLTQHNILAIADTSQVQNADNLTIIFCAVLVIQNCVMSHYADGASMGNQKKNNHHQFQVLIKRRGSRR